MTAMRLTRNKLCVCFVRVHSVKMSVPLDIGTVRNGTLNECYFGINGLIVAPCFNTARNFGRNHQIWGNKGIMARICRKRDLMKLQRSLLITGHFFFWQDNIHFRKVSKISSKWNVYAKYFTQCMSKKKCKKCLQALMLLMYLQCCSANSSL